MIDSADEARLGIVKREIETLLGEKELRGAALLVFANKQDIQGALSEGEIAERLELAKKCKERYVPELPFPFFFGVWWTDGGRNWSIRACSAVKNQGLAEGLDWYESLIRLGLMVGWSILLMNTTNRHGICDALCIPLSSLFNVISLK